MPRAGSGRGLLARRRPKLFPMSYSFDRSIEIFYRRKARLS
jgi:hypothetical protein